VVLALAVLAAAALLAQTPLLQSLRRGADDAGHRLLARDSSFDDVLVVDVDDTSIRALQPRLGAWPWRRDVHALVLGELREMRARRIVFDIVFAEPRDGDAAFAAALRGQADVALAASTGRTWGGRDDGDDASRFSLAAQDALPAVGWASLTLPTPVLAQALAGFGSIGVVGAPLDGDRILRRLPLLHATQGRAYPSLALSALAPAHAAPPADARALLDGMPVDEQGRVDVVLPSNMAALPRVPFARLARAALGVAPDPELAALVAGRTVFVGSTAFLGDTVGTAFGEFGGTTLLAAAVDAMRAGHVLRTPPAALRGLALLLAVLPLLALPLWDVRPRRAALAILAAACAIIALDSGLVQVADIAPVGFDALLTLTLVALLSLGLRWRELSTSNRRLAHERELARAASAAKDELLATVSHELRTPLSALLGIADVMAGTRLDPTQRNYVQIFRTAGVAMGTLIDDLLDFGRIEAGRLEVDAAPFDLSDLLAELHSLFLLRTQAKSLALVLDADPALPRHVIGDRRRLGQVLTNLLGNGVKFTERGSVTLRVTVDREERVHFSVSDTGMGIATMRIEAIFDPFVQGSPGIGRRFGGTGLGLAISRRLVELMGSRLEVQSHPGVGSSFSFAVELTVAPAPSLVDAATLGGAAPAPALNILLAEDNEVNALVMQAELESSPHSLDVAPNGAAAVEKFRRGRYGLVLMDLEMPVMGGLEAVRTIRAIEARESRPPTPIYALTAHAFPRDVAETRAAGCDGHLVKPISQRDLLAAIAAVARGQRPHAL
jgi:signal transduction histidine kinase/ActR/RegA family two-component response regulator